MKYIIKKIFFKFYQNSEQGSEEREFLDENVKKHANILWIMMFVFVLSFLGLDTENTPNVLSAVLGPVMVLGGAWFAVSFGGIPKKLLNIAMDITFWMFSAFMSSVLVAMVSVCIITPYILWPVWILIFFGLWVSCIMYDTADGFKAGLDEESLRHHRYAIAHYKKTGINLNKNKK